MTHVDQYQGIASLTPLKFIQRIELDDKPRFSAVYEHTHDNGYVVTSVPHEDDEDCMDVLKTCRGKCL